MNRRIVLWTLIVLLSSMTVIAQEQDDEPIPPPRRAGTVKIGGAGGFTQGLLFLNIDPINDVMRRENLTPFSKDGLFMVGGQGYGYVLFVPNLRVGGIGMSGHMKSKTLSGNIMREVELGVGYGGVTADYVVNVLPRLDVTFGMMIGGGGMDFKFTRNYGLGQSWDQTWNDFGDTTAAREYSGKLNGSFFIYQPSLNIEFSLLRWIGLRAGVSYLGMAGGSWTRDDKYDQYGVPDNVNGKGWVVNTGIFLGWFGY